MDVTCVSICDYPVIMVLKKPQSTKLMTVLYRLLGVNLSHKVSQKATYPNYKIERIHKYIIYYSFAIKS